MAIDPKHLDLFNKLFSGDSAKRESFTDEDRKVVAALVHNLTKREHYQDFEANVEQITLELTVLRNNIDKNIAALKVYHLARHCSDKLDNLDAIIEKVLNKNCDSKEQYLIYIAFLYDLNRLSFVFKELEQSGIFNHHSGLNALYEDTKKCHQAIKTIGLQMLDESLTPSKPSLFSNGGSAKEASLMTQLAELLGLVNDKSPKP